MLIICHSIKKEYKSVSQYYIIFFPARLFVGKFCSKRCHLFTSPPSPSSDRGKDSKRGKEDATVVGQKGGEERKGQFIFRPLSAPHFFGGYFLSGRRKYVCFRIFFFILAKGSRGENVANVSPVKKKTPMGE